MPFILSNVTKVGFGSFSDTRGIISVQVNTNPQIQRLPVMGTRTPFAEVKQVQRQISLTRYGGGPVYDVRASETCVDANSVQFKFNPVGCGSLTSLNIEDDFYVTSYSFTKQINEYAQESWSLIDKPTISFSTGPEFGSEDKVIVRGVSEGQTTPGLNTGVVLDTSGQYTGITASITAGNPGVGNANELIIGVANFVGGSTTSNGSEEGEGQVTIPYQTIDV